MRVSFLADVDGTGDALQSTAGWVAFPSGLNLKNTEDGPHPAARHYLRPIARRKTPDCQRREWS